MALQTSGTINFNDIHLEAGGTSQTECTLNDTDIRAMIDATLNGPDLAVGDWYGASASIIGGNWSTSQLNLIHFTMNETATTYLNFEPSADYGSYDQSSGIGTLERQWQTGTSPIPAADADDYEIYWESDGVDGDPETVPFAKGESNAVALGGSSLLWRQQRTIVGEEDSSFKITIQKIGDASTAVTRSITFSVWYDNEQ